MAMLLCGWIVIILHLVPSVLSCLGSSSEETTTPKPTPPPRPCCPTWDRCCNDGEYCCELPVEDQGPVGDWRDKKKWNQCICSHRNKAPYDKSKIRNPSEKMYHISYIVKRQSFTLHINFVHFPTFCKKKLGNCKKKVVFKIGLSIG